MFARRKLVLVLTILTLSLGIVSGIALQQEEDPYPRNLAAEEEVITKLNQWRMRLGITPLSRNKDLDALAYAQAHYMAPDIPFTGVVEFHEDQFGQGVFKRAENYGWPSYDFPDRVLVSEIAAYYYDVDSAINFWQHSPIHNASATNAGYRELGVAVLQNKGWLLFYVVLGGRPNVLPVTYDPVRGLLYLTLDRSVFSDDFRPHFVRIEDRWGRRLHENTWMIWSETVPLPAGATDVINVIVSDGIRSISTEVDLYNSRVFPSLPTPMPTSTPTNTPTPPADFATTTPHPPTPIPSPTPLPAGSGFDVEIVYDGNAITLINQSSRLLDLRPLSIYAPEINFSRTAEWWGAYSDSPMSAFPPGQCLQAWSYTIFPGPPALPYDCRVRASGRSVLTPGQRFWLMPFFYVIYNDDIIATCPAYVDSCAFDIPK